MPHEMYTRIEKAIKDLTGVPDALLVDGGEHADLATTVAFALAKQKKQAPVKIAQDLALELKKNPDIAMVTVEAKGPYINFTFGSAFVSEVLKDAVRPGYGNLPKKPTRVVLEHTSANPNGPLHVGHIRNSIIGDTLARAFRKAGYPLEVQYYVNDMGRQIAIVVWGFDNLDSARQDNEKEDAHIARIYIAANRAIEKDEGITRQVNTLMQLVENGDPATVKKFRKEVSRCLDGFAVTLKDLNVRHDRFVWESDFIRNGNTERIINRLKRMPQAREEETLALDLSEFGFTNKYVIRRSDGTSVYAARDLAYHAWKGANFDRIIDVLGADHKLIGAQLQCTMKLIGEKAPEIVHFEFVSLPEGSMSTRAGKFVSADDLITEIRKRAFDEVTARRPELDEATRKAIARSVGLAAIRYDIVKVSPEKSTVFDWKEALDFERQSGPYIQYAHARACSILGKAGSFTECFELETEQEIAVAKKIARFPEVIEQVVAELRPHILAVYARELADTFNTFYHFEPVLKSEGKVRDRRLTLVKAVQNTLKESLQTLGIDAIETM
ncbi:MULTISPECIES: arginine--tRNA ligase [unclassified Methanoregula]|uniref:arginine--tRNA ligase n=1 Tax=unclassified Methanoregula TaxID=2649730 RepID=UPI0009C458B8|nr:MULTISPECIES: arginine--tRNA ligase [unclassified Methanoregula]OPX61687.1 MAG: Arginine--tRNA ligase [Methanoregula sp. PtaB.Bin085]OPY34004.1 MAG: Arginine--tRNA ligase [Methanoregula sp. PtaU1.Bin006]